MPPLCQLVTPIDSWFPQKSSVTSTFGKPHNKYPSCRSTLFHSNDMTVPAQQLNVSAMHNAHVAEQLIQLIIGTNGKIIARSNWIEDLMYDIFPEYYQGCCIGA